MLSQMRIRIEVDNSLSMVQAMELNLTLAPHQTRASLAHVEK